MGTSTKKAWRAYEKGENKRAGELFAELTGKQKSSSQDFIQQGLFFLKLDEFENAGNSFTKAAELEPSNPATFFFLALAQELDEKPTDSQQTLEKLRTVSPHHQGYSSLKLLAELRNGNPTQLLQSFGFGPSVGMKDSRKLSQRIAAGLGMGDPDWLPRELSSSSFLLGPILIEIESKLHPLEVPELQHHPSLLPDDLTGLETAKRSLVEQLSNFRDSLSAGNALKKGKSLLEKAFGIPDRQEQQALLRKAVLYLRIARKKDPFAFRVSYHLAECYIFLSKNEAGEAHDRFRLLQAQSSCLESSKREGVNPYLLFYLAYIQHLLGRPKLAIDYYQEATKKFEKLPEAHYGEGQCHLLLGNRRKAKELLLKAVSSDLALARERLDLFAKLLAEKGTEIFDRPFPQLPEHKADLKEAEEETELCSSLHKSDENQVPNE